MAGKVEISELEWEEFKKNFGYKGGIEASWKAKTPFGSYEITHRRHNPDAPLTGALPRNPPFEPYYMLQTDMRGSIRCEVRPSNLSEAKATVQADYEARILSTFARASSHE